MSLVWKNLSFSTEAPVFESLVSKVSFGKLQPRRKEILTNVHGKIETGELVALLGPSGAGKSSLINCLINGKNYKGFQGEIFVAGITEPIRAIMINQNEGEHLLPSLTVAQSLKYASRLKNPAVTPNRVHEEIVGTLIVELNLKSCENTVVENCSNGEKKRLAIGLELTAFKKPHFFFLDEITSGLDSFVGFKVIKLLSQLAEAHNMAIITTIHQPGYKLFLQFDKAFVLSGRGEMIFNDKPTNLKRTLEECGYNFGIGLYENPADVAIELASSRRRGSHQTTAFYHNSHEVDNNDDQECLVEFYDDLNANCSLSDLSSEDTTYNTDSYQKICKKLLRKISDSYVQFINPLVEPVAPFQTHHVIRQDNGLCKNEAPFSFHTLKVLFLRCCHTSIIQQKKFTFIKLFLHLTVAVVLALLYHRNIGKADSCITLVYPQNDSRDCSCMVTPDSLRGRNSDLSQKNVTFQFFSLLFLMFASLMPTVLIFPTEMKLFLCEFRNGWYSTLSYYIAKTLTEIPFTILFPALYVYFLYWYSSQFGMDHWYEGIVGFMPSRYSHFLWVTIVCCFIAQGLGFLIGILCVRSFNISIILSCSLLLFLFLFSGFFVKRVQMSESVSWLTYFSFVRFGLESLLLIIYGDSRCVRPKYSSVLVIFDLDDKDTSYNVLMLLFHLILTRFLAFILFRQKASPMKFSLNWKIFSKMYCKSRDIQPQCEGLFLDVSNHL